MKKMIGFLVFVILIGCIMGICNTPDTTNVPVNNQSQNSDDSAKVVGVMLIIFSILTIICFIYYKLNSGDSDCSEDSGFRHGWKIEKYLRGRGCGW